MTGQRFGNWILDDLLGNGPMGVVYQAHDATDQYHVAAVKVLTHANTRTADFLARFPANMLAFQRLNHPNVVKFYDAGVQAGQAWYAMEYVEGTNAETVLKTRVKKPGEPGFSWNEEVMSLAIQAARALKHGHNRSILHRNLKPSNFLLTPNGTLKLADFGVAKVFGVSAMSLPAEPMGTAGFLAPEHFNGKPLTRRSDFYSLGGVLYALTTGRALFTATTIAEFLHKHCYSLPDRPVSFVPSIAPELDNLICELIAKDPNRRPGTAAEIIDELDQLRAKLERKGTKVNWPADPGDQSGPMAALSADDEAAVDDDVQSVRPLMSRPLVVVPLFLLVVAVILALAFWPRPNADELFTRAQPLLQSDNPADWDRAWDEYLQPLTDRYPDQFAEEIRAVQTKIHDRKELRKTLEQASRVRYNSEAERIYQRGLKLAQAGEFQLAAHTWQQLNRVFAGTESESRWTKLATIGLAELARSTTDAKRPVTHAQTFQKLLETAQAKKAAHDPTSAAMFDAMENLYRNEPGTLEMIRKAR